MVILIGGESHTGKTNLAQQLLQRYHIPYTSLDHIKMGLVRGWDNCPFSPTDSDDVISNHMWGVVNGIINTCTENRQNIILEGCYLPPSNVCKVCSDDVICVYLVLSESYIKNHFDNISQYENVIEHRKFSQTRTLDELILENDNLKRECIKFDQKYFEIQDNYEQEMRAVHGYLDKIINCQL